MGDWKQNLQTIRDTHLNNKATIKGDNNMIEKITIGIKFSGYGLRIDTPNSLIGKRAVLMIDRVAGKLSLRFDMDGNCIGSTNGGKIGMAQYGRKHLGNIKLFVGEYTKYEAVLTADGLYVSGFELPKVQNKLKRETGASKPRMGRTNITPANDEATVANLKATLRDLNYYGRQLGVEWGIEDGRVVGSINIKRKI